MTRADFDGIDTLQMRGLEFGALHNPRFRPDDPNVVFVDHASTRALQEKYRDDPALTDHLAHLVDVDVVWAQGMGHLRDAVQGGEDFDFAFASHVFEHLANPLGWLEEVATVLKAEGIVSLIIPDKRYCFDVNRSLTEIGALVDAYLLEVTAPRPRDIFDFHSKIVAVDTGALWAGTMDYSRTTREDIDVDLFPMEQARRAARGEYIDVHAGVYTPRSFLDVYRRANRLGLVQFTVDALKPTQPGQLEFHVLLRRCECSPDARRVAIEASIARAEAALPAQMDTSAGRGTAHPVQLSPREYRTLQVKRQAMSRARATAARVRAKARALRR